MREGIRFPFKEGRNIVFRPFYKEVNTVRLKRFLMRQRTGYIYAGAMNLWAYLSLFCGPAIAKRSGFASLSLLQNFSVPVQGIMEIVLTYIELYGYI